MMMGYLALIYLLVSMGIFFNVWSIAIVFGAEDEEK